MPAPDEIPLSRCRALGAVLLGALMAMALIAVAPRPASAWSSLRHPTDSADPSAPLIAVIGFAAWALAAYLVIGVLVTAAARRTGLLGRLCTALAARTVPAVIRRTIGIALGAGLVLGPAVPAQAALPGPGAQGHGAATAASSLDWPAVTTPTRRPAPAADPAPAPGASAAVVVQPGDTLWALAERSLRADGRTPTAAAVAATWPSWWAANREAVGDDPNLLRPGTSLLAPPAS